MKAVTFDMDDGDYPANGPGYPSRAFGTGGYSALEHRRTNSAPMIAQLDGETGRRSLDVYTSGPSSYDGHTSAVVRRPPMKSRSTDLCQVITGARSQDIR